jgi:hypothetical protein
MAQRKSESRREQSINTETPHASLLDRSIDLTSISPMTLLWIIVGGLMLVTSLPGRTNWPLSIQESAIALDAWRWLHGYELSEQAASHPALVQLTGFALFLFGDSDYVVRLAPLGAGFGVLVALFWARNLVGNLTALSIAIVWTLSPTMTMSALRLDAGGPLVLATLVIFLLALALVQHISPSRSVVLGIAIGIALAVHPLGWIYAPLAFVLGLSLIKVPDTRIVAPYVTAGLLTTLILTGTWMLSRPLELFKFFGSSFRALWQDYLSTAGDGIIIMLVHLATDELLALVLISIGIIFSALGALQTIQLPGTMFGTIGVWAIFALIIGLLLGSPHPDLYAISTLPFIVMAGLGLSMLLHELMETGTFGGRTILATLAGTGVIIAVVRFADLIAIGPSGGTVGWVASAIALALLVIVPLAVALLRLVRITGIAVIPTVLLGLVLVIGSVSLRSIAMLPITSEDRTGSILTSGSTTVSVKSTSQQIARVSQDITGTTRSIQDQVGGHGLRVEIADDLLPIFGWYLRNFPSVAITNPPRHGEDEMGAHPEIIIAQPDMVPDTQFTYQQRTMPMTTPTPPVIDGATTGTLIRWTVNPLNYRDFVNFIVYRQVEIPGQPSQFTLHVHEEYARLFWGNDGASSIR